MQEITKLQTCDDNRFIYVHSNNNLKKSHKQSQTINTTITGTILSQCFESTRKTTIETKMQHFQFRLLYGILTTNIYFKMCGIQSDHLCSFGFNEPEILEHLFATYICR